MHFLFCFSGKLCPDKIKSMGQDVKIKFLGIPVYSKRTVNNETEKRSSDVFPQSDLQNPADWLFSTFGYPSASNVLVTEATALTLSAVWSCVQVLAETLSMLPLNIFNLDKQGSRTLAIDDPLYFLLHDKPNPIMTSFHIRETMMLHYCLTGNAYAIIHKDGYGNVTELELIQWPKEVFIVRSTLDGLKYYQYRGKTYNDTEILHICGISFDGLKGISPIQYARENIGTGISLQNFGGTFFKNGARPSGVVEWPGKMSDPSYKNLKDSFKEQYSGTDNVGKTIILEGGAKYVAMSLSNEDAQYLSSRVFSLEEIARIYRVPQHMIGNLGKATNNNIEHLGIEFATYTMTPHVTRWEQEMNSKLILVRDRGKKYVKFNMNGLMRGDAASRSALYKELFYTGSMSPNEIREMEEMNHYDGGDKKYIPVNMVPSELAGMNVNTKPVTNDK